VKSPRISHLALGLQAFAAAAYLTYSAVPLGWWATTLTIPFLFWLVSVGLMPVGYSMWPQRFPRLYIRESSSWKLRRAHSEAVAQELRDLGFVEVGVKVEQTFLMTIPTRQFWHPEHQTFASMSVHWLTPKVSLICKCKGGTIFYSGRSLQGRHRTVVSELLEGSSAREQLAHHLLGIRNAELSPALPPAERSEARDDFVPTKEELDEWCLKITREWYVATFATEAQWEAWRAKQPPSVRVEELTTDAAEEILDEEPVEEKVTEVPEAMS
jgi:hypothetical protein